MKLTHSNTTLTALAQQGGFTENAFDYAKGGLELDSDYPYTSGKAGVTGSCDADSSKYVVKTTGYKTVSSSASGESSMASYVGSTGPLSVCVDASTWSSYTGGILSRCGTSVDHCKITPTVYYPTPEANLS